MTYSRLSCEKAFKKNLEHGSKKSFQVRFPAKTDPKPVPKLENYVETWNFQSGVSNRFETFENEK